MEIAALDPVSSTQMIFKQSWQTRSSLLFYDHCDSFSCALSNGLQCALCVALYAVRGLYEQANEHLAYKAKLSGINLS